MRTSPTHTLDPRAIRVWRLTGALFTLLYAAPVLVLYVVLSRRLPLPDFVLPLLLALAALLLLWEVVLLPPLRYRTWRYQVNEEEIYLQHGVFVLHRILLPMTKVQHVDTAQGPLLRLYGLASVTVYTGAGKHKIPALRLHDADALRDQIARYAKVDEDNA